MRIREIVDVKSQQLTQQIDGLKRQKRQLRATKVVYPDVWKFSLRPGRCRRSNNQEGNPHDA